MNWVAGCHLLELTSKKRESAHRITELLAEKNEAASEVYYVKCHRLLLDTTETTPCATKDVTVIYLSFTNVRMSMALPGAGVSFEGGAKGKQSRK